MKKFLDEDFLLKTESAVKIYNAIKDLPIIDYHCHLDAKEIYEDKVYGSITDIWLSGDHYKWRAMRWMGVEEGLITGKDSGDYERFLAYATVLPRLAGNPLHHFSHLELKRYFGIEEALTPETAKAVYERAAAALKTLSARKIIEKSNVSVIVTTNDPLEDLKYHKLLQEDTGIKTKVLPAFRPDRLLNIEKHGFSDYIKEAGKKLGVAIDSLAGVKAALSDRLSYFASFGAPASDHGLESLPKVNLSEKDAETAFQKALAGEPITKAEEDAYKTNILLYLAKEYCKYGMVMELHFGCLRNPNSFAFSALGADAGFDTIKKDTGADNLAALLDAMENNGGLPKTLIFSLNPADNAVIAAAAGSFQKPGVKGRTQHGAAWWFNDHFYGIEEHLKNYASLAPVDTFVGMLTDSRSLLSYARHEYFRRILADYLGSLVEEGAYPESCIGYLTDTARDISYHNAARFFGFFQN